MTILLKQTAVAGLPVRLTVHAELRIKARIADIADIARIEVADG